MKQVTAFIVTTEITNEIFDFQCWPLHFWLCHNYSNLFREKLYFQFILKSQYFQGKYLTGVNNKRICWYSPACFVSQ